MTKQLDKQALLKMLDLTLAKVALTGLRCMAVGNHDGASRSEAICSTIDLLQKSVATGVFDYDAAADTIPSPPPSDEEQYERDAILYQSPPVVPFNHAACGAGGGDEDVWPDVHD